MKKIIVILLEEDGANPGLRKTITTDKLHMVINTWGVSITREDRIEHFPWQQIFCINEFFK